MKVIIHYEDNDNPELHKSLKITLPKSWKTGPTSKILCQFVESYNGNETLGAANPLQEDDMHLAIFKPTNDGGRELVALCSDAIVVDEIPDRADLYMRHGPSETLQQVQDAKDLEVKQQRDLLANTVQCTHFGCRNRFPPGGPYPTNCVYHSKPPVFHETVKFWSCCPQKKAYDWESFQNIPGCQTGTCTDVKETTQKLFLGGTDLREQTAPVQLKSIDDFNKAQAAGGAEAAPVLDRLRNVLEELGIEKELYNQVIQGIGNEVNHQSLSSPADHWDAVKKELANKLKTAMKNIAAEQQRIK